MGESGIVAAICGDFGCPGVFVSGDAATCREVKALLGPEVVDAVVKEGLTRFAAKHLSASDACQLIEDCVHEALSKCVWPKPLKFPVPVRFEVEIASPERANQYVDKTEVEVLDPRRVASTGGSFWEAWDYFGCGEENGVRDIRVFGIQVFGYSGHPEGIRYSGRDGDGGVEWTLRTGSSVRWM